MINAQKFGQPIVVGRFSSDPADPTNGCIYYNFTSNVFKAYVNGGWQILLSAATLTASRAVVTNGSGQLAVATTTSTEIGYVNGVTSAIQTQLNSKEQTFSGLEPNTNFGLSYDQATRTLTVTYTSSPVVWSNGTAYVKTGSESLTHTNVSSGHYYYYNSSGVLSVQTTFPAPALNNAIVAYVYYNTATGKGILSDERHPGASGMPDATHKYLHETRGTQLRSGCIASGYTLNTATDAGRSYAISSGVIDDEDLATNISALADAGPYRIVYRTGTDGLLQWDWVDTSVNGILTSGTDLAYNQNNGGTWQQSPVASSNRWMNYYVAAIPSLSGFQIVVFQGQAFYTTQALANAETPTALSGVTAFSPEICFLYQMTYRRITNAAASTLVSVTALRANNVSISGGVTPSDHSALTGRETASSHPATAISNTPSGNMTDTDVQSAINTLQNGLDNRLIKLSSDINPTSFAMANNQAAAADVTGLVFANASVRSFRALVSIYINATTPLYQTVEILGVQKASTWEMSENFAGDVTGVTFTITSAGQIQYRSANTSGWTSTDCRFRAETLAV